MSLETFVISGDRELSRALDPERWWAALERNAPRALTPVVRSLRAAAPKGRTGKLGRRFETRTKRIRQGFIQGVEVGIGALVPYGHLVESGHNIIARGPTRKGKKLTRAARASARTGLKERRAAGAIGHVPGVFFALKALQSRREEVLSLLGRLVMQEISR